MSIADPSPWPNLPLPELLGIAAWVVLLLALAHPSSTLGRDASYLVRKSYPGSVTSRLTGVGASALTRPRFTVLDATIVAAISMVLTATLMGADPPVLSSALGGMLCLLMAFDLRYRTLPDTLTLPLAALGLLANSVSGIGPVLAIVGLVGSAAILWTVREAFLRIRAVEGLGGGDVKLVAAMGAWLGPFGCAEAVALAAASAIACEIALALHERRAIDRRRRIPFGAYLAVAFWLAWCMGSRI